MPRQGDQMGRGIFLLLIILEIVPTTVLADDAANCRTAAGDDAIAACSRIIESSWYRGQNLAIIYNNRGVAPAGKGEYDRALQTSTTPYGSIQNSPLLITIAAWSGTKGKITTAELRTTTRLSGSIRI
jgi:hypothetical protein